MKLRCKFLWRVDTPSLQARQRNAFCRGLLPNCITAVFILFERPRSG
jgi:hypothetical protein